MTLLVSLFVGTGILLMLISLPMIRRRVGPNHLYGLRVPATFADEWVWYEANARSGRDLFGLGLMQVMLAIALALLPSLSETAYALINAVVITAGTTLFAIIGWRRANRLLEQRRRERAGNS